MTHTLKDLLDPEQREALIEAVANRPLPHEEALVEAIATTVMDLTGPERLVHAIMGTRPTMTLEAFVDAVVDPLTLPEDVIPARIVCAPEPVLGQDVVEINGTLIDLRGDDPWFVTVCIDCRMTTKTLVAPEGVDLSQPRVVRCEKCAKAYLKAAAAEGKAVRVIRKPQVAKHQPRITTGAVQPVSVTHIAEKEQGMDLNQYSTPQLTALIERAQDILRTKAEDALAVNVKEALVERAETEVADKALMVADRETRVGLVLPAFTVKDVEIPALDMSEVTDLGTVMHAKMRSPYNKALYRTGQTIIEPDKATYGEIAKVHEALRGLGADPLEGKKVKVKKAKAAKVTKVTAVVEPAAKAKATKAQIAALAKVRGITKGEAKVLLDSVL